MKEMPEIDQEKCQRCGLCVNVCACGALQIVEDVITIMEVDECRWCTLCELVCPYSAISCPFEIIIEDDVIIDNRT